MGLDLFEHVTVHAGRIFFTALQLKPFSFFCLWISSLGFGTVGFGFGLESAPALDLDFTEFDKS